MRAKVDPVAETLNVQLKQSGHFPAISNKTIVDKTSFNDAEKEDTALPIPRDQAVPLKE